LCIQMDRTAKVAKFKYQKRRTGLYKIHPAISDVLVERIRRQRMPTGLKISGMYPYINPLLRDSVKEIELNLFGMSWIDDYIDQYPNLRHLKIFHLGYQPKKPIRHPTLEKISVETIKDDITLDLQCPSLKLIFFPSVHRIHLNGVQPIQGLEMHATNYHPNLDSLLQCCPQLEYMSIPSPVPLYDSNPAHFPPKIVIHQRIEAGAIQKYDQLQRSLQSKSICLEMDLNTLWM